MHGFIKFALIGGAATLLQFLLLGLFVELLNIAPIWASALSYCVSAIFNYIANYYLTFQSNSSHRQTFPKFVITVALGLTISTLLFAMFHHALLEWLPTTSSLLKSSYLIAQLFATLLTLIANFLMHKFWIYRS